MKLAIIFLTGYVLLLTQNASATACGELVYNKHGKFRKYEYVNNTASENTKKHGSSTTSGVSTEGSTASVDPGVSTGASHSMQQSTSSNGECRWFGLLASREEYQDYLAQNIYEIKHEISLGQGGHLEVLAAAFKCTELGKKVLPAVLQKNFDHFVDFDSTQSQDFANSLKVVVEKNLSSDCHAI